MMMTPPFTFGCCHRDSHIRSDNPEAAQKYGVSAMPTFVFIKGGEVVDRLMGANSDRLKEVCSKAFHHFTVSMKYGHN